MKVRWSFRAANDRSAQFAQESNPTVSAKESTYLFKGRCFIDTIIGKGFEVGAVVNEAPVELQSRE